jgi:hypothetical protein
MTDWHVPGMAVVVVKDDSVVFIKGFWTPEFVSFSLDPDGSVGELRFTEGEARFGRVKP